MLAGLKSKGRPKKKLKQFTGLKTQKSRSRQKKKDIKNSNKNYAHWAQV